MWSEPHLEVRFRHQIGALKMDVSFTAHAPWTVIFGPSGSGKSTILRVIAGLETPQSGFVRIGGEVVFDRECGVNRPSHLRPMRWSAQRSMLMPRKSVQWCLGDGIDTRDARSQGKMANDELHRALNHFKLRDIQNKLPHELSGGQRQRVAAIRAAVGAKNKILLLDEPFTGLDADVRDELIAAIRSWLGDTPIVSVTHDIGEVFRLGADVVRIAEGKVTAQGPAAKVLADERHRLMDILDGSKGDQEHDTEEKRAEAGE